jgi:hypothetical protein
MCVDAVQSLSYYVFEEVQYCLDRKDEKSVISEKN